MNEDEFKSGVRTDGSRLMQPDHDPMPAIHGRGLALLAHMKRMQEKATEYITPDYYKPSHPLASGSVGGNGELAKEFRDDFFINDMLYMLDGPEQRAAEAELSFDYVAEAEQTLSHEWHGQMVSLVHFKTVLDTAIDSLTELDRIKKAIFYGRFHGDAFPVPGEVDMSAMPAAISGHTGMTFHEAADYIHGVVGLATEAGELLENMRDVLAGKPLDRVNVKEEVGDAKWYMAILSRVCGFEWGDDERTNIAKLRARFPDKFKSYDANNRDLSTERDILEGSPIQEQVRYNIEGDGIYLDGKRLGTVLNFDLSNNIGKIVIREDGDGPIPDNVGNIADSDGTDGA